jgi:hypothetical protein
VSTLAVSRMLLYVFCLTTLFSSEESIARAKYHLALAIRSMPEKLSSERANEADRLVREAESVREGFNLGNGCDQTSEEKLKSFDFLVSMWAGRTVIQKQSQTGSEDIVT